MSGWLFIGDTTPALNPLFDVCSGTAVAAYDGNVTFYTENLQNDAKEGKWIAALLQAAHPLRHSLTLIPLYLLVLLVFLRHPSRLHFFPHLTAVVTLALLFPSFLPGEWFLHTLGHNWGASIFAWHGEMTQDSHRQTVKAMDLACYLADHVIPRRLDDDGDEGDEGDKGVVVMKMDTEGSEYTVIPELFFSRTICHVDKIYAEIHQIGRLHGCLERISSLTNRGASYTYCGPICYILLSSFNGLTVTSLCRSLAHRR